MSEATQKKSGARTYEEGTRVESTCRCCGQPIWIVYHGPNRNHTIEPRREDEQ